MPHKHHTCILRHTTKSIFIAESTKFKNNIKAYLYFLKMSCTLLTLQLLLLTALNIHSAGNKCGPMVASSGTIPSPHADSRPLDSTEGIHITRPAVSATAGIRWNGSRHRRIL